MLRENEKNHNTKEKKFHRKKTKILDKDIKEFILINIKALHLKVRGKTIKSNDASVEEIVFLSFLKNILRQENKKIHVSLDLRIFLYFILKCKTAQKR